MSIIKCYACASDISVLNQSSEHILPNSIGGRLKSDYLLCRTCNNDFGTEHEAEFADQLKFFTGRLPIKRDRGDNKKLKAVDKVSGLPIVIDESGKVSLAHVVMLEKPDPEKGGRLKFLAPNEREAKKIVDKYKEKFPNAKIDIAIPDPSANTSASHIEISGAIGSLSFFKTVQKCFLNLYAHEGGDRSAIRDEANTLFKSNSEPRTWFYSDSTEKKNKSSLYHTIAVFGRPTEKILFGYAEFFGGIQVLGVLNDDYKGAPIYFTHSVDTLNGKINTCDVSIELTRDQILHFTDKKPFNHEEISTQLGHIEDSVKSTHYFSNIIQDAMDKTLMRPEKKDQIITKEMVGELVDELMKSLMPNIQAASRKRHEEAEKAFKKELEERKKKK